MIGPYKMALVSCITSLLLIGGVLFYRYLYPKNKTNLFILLIFISLLPLTSLLRSGTYESGDFNIHVYRIISFYDSLKEGNLMPSWSGELNGTYGLPVFIFNYSLPYYFASFFHYVGFSFITSMKIFLGAAFFFSGIFMYLWIKELTGNKLASFTSAVFYLFSPYHLIDLHFRATPGESLIFTLVPLLFLFISKYFREKKFVSLVLILLFTDLLFMAHPVLAAMFLGTAILYSFSLTFFKKDFKSLSLVVLSLTIGVFASIYVWFPFLLYDPYTFKLSPGQATGFYPFHLLFYSPWRYGFLFQGPYGELAQIIGYTQIGILIVSLILIFKKKLPQKIRASYIFWISLCIFTIFLMHPSSQFLWHYTPNLQSMMTPYARLSLVISFCVGVISAYLALIFYASKTKKNILYVLLFITIAYTILNWGHRRVIPEIGDEYLRSHAWISVRSTPTFMNSKWAESESYWFPRKPDSSLEIIQGKAEMKLLKKTSTKHTYVINAQTEITIKENTLYFPKWTLKSNDKYINIYPGKKGIINAKLPRGLQYIELTYEDLPLYKLTKIISAGSMLAVLFIIIFSIITNYKKSLISLKNYRK